KDGIGVSVDVEIVEPESLEQSVGKIRRIVDLRRAGRWTTTRSRSSR
ncbi:hypothetical protein, partial [Streptomyces cinerochromogenes]